MFTLNKYRKHPVWIYLHAEKQNGDLQRKCILVFTVNTVLVVGLIVLGIPFADVKQRLGDLEQMVGRYCNNKTSNELIEYHIKSVIESQRSCYFEDSRNLTKAIKNNMFK